MKPVDASAVRVIARGISRRPLQALENTMATLALDAREPLALEIARDDQGIHFQLRARTPEAVSHLASQLQALYPQSQMVWLSPWQDPLRLERDEAVTVVELAVRGQPYLSLHTPDARSWHHSGSSQQTPVGDDPLLALLGALQDVPQGMRAIAQLALVPAKAQWSRPYWCKAVEHPLESERERKQQVAGKSSQGPSMSMIFAITLLVLLALLWRRFGMVLLPLVPLWIKQGVLDAVRGHLPPLTGEHILQLVVMAALIIVPIFLTSRLLRRVHGGPMLYDQRAVGEKTKRVAYRACLRLLVIGNVEPLPTEIFSRNRMEAKVSLNWMKANLFRLWQWAWTRSEQGRKRRQIATRLAAAYRQYENPAGNVLVPQLCHLRRAHLVASHQPKVARSWRGFRRLFRQHGPVPSASRRRRLRFTLRCLRLLTWQLLHWLLVGRARWQRGVSSSPLYLSIEEVAALWHLIPEQDAPEIAGLERDLARSRPLPPRLANASPTELLPSQIGECQHAGQCWPVFAPAELFHHNSLALAATGKGKSTLFSHLALAHLVGNAQEGLFFMEPHGDTISALLGSTPLSRREDVTLIDLADETAVVGLNPLDMTQGRGRDKTVDNILAVFIAFWQKQRSWGPRTENILQFALLALTEANLRRIERDGEEMGAEEQYTLLDVIPLLQKPGFRRMVLDEVRDPVVLDWFKHYYDPLRQSFRDEMISSIINKISKYAAAKVSRRLLGQSRATVRLADDICSGRAILVNTASGIVGEEVSALVGATLVGLFQTALAEQMRLRPEERRRFWVVIDEFQTYAGIDYNSMLAELRKYGGSFALATQSLSYLDEVDRSLKPTVLANSDHLFCFAMEAADAKQLSPYLDGLETADLVSLPAYTCYARWTMQGQRLPAFSLHIASPPLWDAVQALTIRQRSHERHARPVALVDEEVSPEPSLVQNDVSFWPDTDEKTADSEELTESAQSQARLEPARRRGGRGKRGKSQTHEPTEPQASGAKLTHPYALDEEAFTESGRLHRRAALWHPERDESGEIGRE